jgi:predicted enzyme related to lactoylglutathione lyase
VGNAVVHFEGGAAQEASLVAFYGELFGWGLNGSSAADYTLIDARGGHGINGGISKSQSGDPRSTFYVGAK